MLNLIINFIGENQNIMIGAILILGCVIAFKMGIEIDRERKESEY